MRTMQPSISPTSVASVPEGSTVVMEVTTTLGNLLVAADDDLIVRVAWTTGRDRRLSRDPPTPLLAEAARQLRAYAAGRLQRFELPLRAEGSTYQQSVWQVMAQIPYGETRTYGELAEATRSGARAVGRACGANPIPIIVPCHRVVGRNGRLTGFSGGEGVATKAELIALERRHAAPGLTGLPLFSHR